MFIRVDESSAQCNVAAMKFGRHLNGRLLLGFEDGPCFPDLFQVDG